MPSAKGMGSSSVSGEVASVSVSPPPSVSCGKGFFLGVFSWGFCLGVSAVDFPEVTSPLSASTSETWACCAIVPSFSCSDITISVANSVLSSETGSVSSDGSVASSSDGARLGISTTGVSSALDVSGGRPHWHEPLRL